MTTLSRAGRWAALAVGAFTALLCGGMSWLVGGALKMSRAAPCPHCDSAHVDSVTPRLYEQQSTWYRCHECGRIWSIPKPPTIPG
jgi:DNA-directed RNA polymerase subunit RPC12/RpoP